MSGDKKPMQALPAEKRHPGLSSPEELIKEAQNGRMFILVDDEDRENEGDLVIPAQMATPDSINFMAKHARGLICLALTRQRVEQLELPLMSYNNETRHRTAFTVSIEAREGVTTGISAADRARTVLTAIDPSKGKDDIVTPGHVFPLVARDGGVLVRAGHTEAAVDFARLAGLTPAGVICEVMNDDGTMARLPEIMAFAQLHGLKVGTIADLIGYRRQHDTIVDCIAEKEFTSQYGGAWKARVYVNTADGSYHLALVKGELSSDEPTLVRMHALSFLDDALGQVSSRANQLQCAMVEIGRQGKGALVLVRKADKSSFEGVLHEEDLDRTSDGVIRNYGVGAQILVDLGLHKLILLTNSQRHELIGLEGYGLSVVDSRPIPPFTAK